MNRLVSDAQYFATKAHDAAGQRRRFTNERFICHPGRVAFLVASATEHPVAIAVAWLHDVIEDTYVTEQQLKSVFGTEISDCVATLTNDFDSKLGNRAHRKSLERIQMSRADAIAQSVRLADIIDNVDSLATYDPAFANVYIRESFCLLPYLKAGDELLFQLAAECLVRSQSRIKPNL